MGELRMDDAIYVLGELKKRLEKAKADKLNGNKVTKAEKIKVDDVTGDFYETIRVINGRKEKFTSCYECIHKDEDCKKLLCVHAFGYLLECFDPESFFKEESEEV